MPPRDIRLRIEDILEALAAITRYVKDMDFETFAWDERTVDAVVWRLAVIGEAARSLPEVLTDAHPELPWAHMRGIRNIVVHEYFGVDKRILWDTIRQNLPNLQAPLEKLLAELSR